MFDTDTDSSSDEVEPHDPIELDIKACLNLNSLGRYGLYVVTELQNEKTKIFKLSCSKRHNNLVSKEFKFLRKLKHDNIVEAQGFYQLTDKRYGLLMEYCENGDLYGYLKENKLRQDRLINYMQQLTKAVDHCHRHNIVHADIKPENILLCDDYKVLKLCDFDAAFYNNQPRRGVIGTPMYMAPEVITGQVCDYHVDIWSLGIVFYEMWSNHTPVQDAVKKLQPSNKEIYEWILAMIDKHQPTIDLKDFHPYDNKILDMVQRILYIQPNKRCSLSELLLLNNCLKPRYITSLV